ncbi:hypothetical protein PDL71_01195 [Lacibacter sp. MH-610]|uniref:hypothetical protein n=1 Tax=Lacibacter sp. MH-610 TaxID=3020883 RepID=UPI003892C598
MRQLQMAELENLTAGGDADCGWAAAEYAASLAVGIITGGWGLVLLPFTLRNALKACDLI